MDCLVLGSRENSALVFLLAPAKPRSGGWLAGLVGWLAGWLGGWLVGWLGGWFSGVGLPVGFDLVVVESWQRAELQDAVGWV